MSRQVQKPISFGKPITINGLRNHILDSRLGANDTIVLHPVNFRELAAEFEMTYKEPMPLPYRLISVLIKEDFEGIAPKGQIVPVWNDNESSRKPKKQLDESFHAVVFRCSWCGNLVDYDGSQLSVIDLIKREDLLRDRKEKVTVKAIKGYCHPDHHQAITTKSI